MAHDDKKDEGKKEKMTEKLGLHSIPAMIAQSLMDVAVKEPIQAAVNRLKEYGKRKDEERAQDRQARARNKHYFAAAMVKLKARDLRSWKIIKDFNEQWLDNDTDREDFQHNSAKVGTDTDERMDDTVDFLIDLAQLPGHQEREVSLTALGFIGARSVDMSERAQALLESAKEVAKNLPANLARQAQNLDTNVKSAIEEFEGSARANNITRAGRDVNQSLRDKLARLKR
jgi:hypothetical protein